jgi:hypothetical protein
MIIDPLSIFAALIVGCLTIYILTLHIQNRRRG